MIAQRQLPRLYLTTPALEDTAAFAPAIAAAFEAADIAAVLLRLADADERTLINRIRTVAPAIQGRDAALLLDGRPELVARSGADGAHLFGIEAFTAALSMLKPDRIAGAGGVRNRHDAMAAGESGADYVMFGDPDASGRRPRVELTLDMIAWWAELIELPCIGYAATLDEIAPLAQAGADFVALGEWTWQEPQRAGEVVAAAARALAARAA